MAVKTKIFNVREAAKAVPFPIYEADLFYANFDVSEILGENYVIKNWNDIYRALNITNQKKVILDLYPKRIARKRVRDYGIMSPVDDNILVDIRLDLFFIIGKPDDVWLYNQEYAPFKISDNFYNAKHYSVIQTRIRNQTRCITDLLIIKIARKGK